MMKSSSTKIAQTKMTKPHIMSEEEWSGWQSALSALAVQATQPSASAAKAPKPPASRLSQSLLNAAKGGNAQEVVDLLAKGASPNSRERHGEKRSAIAAAIEGGSAQAALEIMRAGGWNAPSFWLKTASKEFDEAVSAGALTGAILMKSIERTLPLFFHECASWLHLTQAFEICGAAAPSNLKPAGELVGEVVRRGRWDMALDALNAGNPFDLQCWTVVEKRLSSMSLSGQADMQALLALATHPVAFESMPPSAAMALFAAAVSSSSRALLEGLLNARLRPSPDWLVPASCLSGAMHGVAPGVERKSHIPLLVACAAQHDGISLLKSVSLCPAAVEAAKVHKTTPWVLEKFSLAGLQELLAIGVPLDAVDVDGRGLFHVWAAVDTAPRSGWATLGRALPDVMALRDSNGNSPVQMMASRLQSGEAQSFLASVARLESREIRQAAGEAPQKKGMAKTRARL